MAGDRLPRAVEHRKFGGDQRGQLLLDIGPHPIVFGEGGFGRIDIETRAKAEIPRPVRIVGHPVAAR
ncbi:hypothetical protein ASE67_05970 [Sphingomonas sp. Leaf23]|nr:hypothetical protein ASE67_05970 [Sphingomonas sp. Leaf23]